MGQFTQGKRPSPTAIREAVRYLDDLGLSIYGANIDLKDGEVRCGNRDFDAEGVIRLRQLTEQDALFVADWK